MDNPIFPVHLQGLDFIFPPDKEGYNRWHKSCSGFPIDYVTWRMNYARLILKMGETERSRVVHEYIACRTKQK